MINDKKIEEAAKAYGENNDCSVIGRNGRMLLRPELENAFETGANWAINKFLKDLWHSIEEEPKHGKQITYIRVNGIAKTIILNEEADKYNNTPSQIWHNICKNYKVACWFYIDDLFPKEGGEE